MARRSDTCFHAIPVQRQSGRQAYRYASYIHIDVGYSEDTVDVLTAGKSLNLILFNKEDIDAAIAGNLGFKAILKAKLRKAAEEGLVYYPTAIELVESAGTKRVAIERLHFDRMTDRVLGRPGRSSADLIIVGEGDADSEVLAHLAQRILEHSPSSK